MRRYEAARTDRAASLHFGGKPENSLTAVERACYAFSMRHRPTPGCLLLATLVLVCVTATRGVGQTTGDPGAGGTVTTDPDGNGATPSNPLEAAVTTPNSGTITIDEAAPTTTPPDGLNFLGPEIAITAPPADPTDPLVLGFSVDASVLPADIDPSEVQVLANGVQLAPCAGAPGVASPDACIASATSLPDGDVGLTVLSSNGGDWNVAAPTSLSSGIGFTKLVVLQDETRKNKAKLVFTSKDKNAGAIRSGATGSPAMLSATFEVFYADNPGNDGLFSLPSSGWTTNSRRGAKYLNPNAPGTLPQNAGSGQGVKSVVIKPGMLVKITAKSRGEDAAKLDLLSSAPGPGGITAILTVKNAGDGFVYRMCSTLPNGSGEITVRDVSGGTGRKLTTKTGVPIACP